MAESLRVDQPAATSGAALLVARIERLPFTTFHLKARGIVGTATFFDAFDSLAIAYVLPVLIPQFQLNPASIGALISVGFIGQFVGAIFFGWLAERRGRMPALLGSVALYSACALLAGFAWDYTSLFVIRTIQGIGLGGEVPIAATYISEISKARGRGRFVLLYEMLFSIGLFCAALLGAWVVPTLGWRWMFWIGALPGLLMLPLRWLLPESPRWLASHGRVDEADRIVSRLEAEATREGREVPPPVVSADVAPRATRWQELFEGIYRRRTLAVWVMWATSYFATYGISTWLPSIYTSVFQLPLPEALRYSLTTQALALVGSVCCALLIDRTGRKAWFTGAFFVGGTLLIILWLSGATSAQQVLVLASLANLAFGTIALGLYVYSPEIYPTRMRALGASVGTAWLRVASAIGPFVMGIVVASYPLATAFLLFGVVLLIGGVVVVLWGTETRGRVLEEISP